MRMHSFLLPNSVWGLFEDIFVVSAEVDSGININVSNSGGS